MFLRRWTKVALSSELRMRPLHFNKQKKCVVKHSDFARFKAHSMQGDKLYSSYFHSFCVYIIMKNKSVCICFTNVIVQMKEALFMSYGAFNKFTWQLNKYVSVKELKKCCQYSFSDEN